MNNLYFACVDCKIYIDAGYRWAYWELEKAGVVKRGKEVNLGAVLAAEKYWNPTDEDSSEWLEIEAILIAKGYLKAASTGERTDWLYKEVFPPLRQFLAEHRDDRMVFGQYEDFVPDDDDSELDWMQVGYLLRKTPRYFVEVLGLRTWDEVSEHMEGQVHTPAWWSGSYLDEYEKRRRKFEELVSEKYGS